LNTDRLASVPEGVTSDIGMLNFDSSEAMNTTPSTPSAFNKIATWYQTLAVMLLTFMFLAVFVNIGLYFYVRRLDRNHSVNPVASYGLDTELRAYPGWTAASVTGLIKETYTARYLVHHPFAQFSNEPRSGKYVSVLAPGFRVVKNQSPWPPRSVIKNVFVFGGSTAFGLGVTNQETIASYVQEMLERKTNTPVAVYNFGTPAYASRQEATLFFDFLSSGIAPETAVFIDGLNEYAWGEKPALTTEISRDVEGKAVRDWLYLKVPMVRVAYNMIHRSPVSSNAPNDDARAEVIIKRWRDNKRIIEAMAAAFNVRVLFVWQPIPYYNYDPRNDPFCQPTHPCTSAPHEALYRRMKTLDGGLGGDYLWLGDLQAGRTENLYVDSVHYSPAFSKQIAEAIAENLVQN